LPRHFTLGDRYGALCDGVKASLRPVTGRHTALDFGGGVGITDAGISGEGGRRSGARVF
jgi:hypothetical protein